MDFDLTKLREKGKGVEVLAGKLSDVKNQYPNLMNKDTEGVLEFLDAPFESGQYPYAVLKIKIEDNVMRHVVLADSKVWEKFDTGNKAFPPLTAQAFLPMGVTSSEEQDNGRNWQQKKSSWIRSVIRLLRLLRLRREGLRKE